MIGSNGILKEAFVMKKFIALIVMLCTVMISSPASATLIDDYFHATNNQILCMKWSDLTWSQEAEQRRQKAEQRRLKEEEARRNEFYQLIFTVTFGDWNHCSIFEVSVQQKSSNFVHGVLFKLC